MKEKIILGIDCCGQEIIPVKNFCLFIQIDTPIQMESYGVGLKVVVSTFVGAITRNLIKKKPMN